MMMMMMIILFLYFKSFMFANYVPNVLLCQLWWLFL